MLNIRKVTKRNFWSSVYLFESSSMGNTFDIQVTTLALIKFILISLFVLSAWTH